VTTSLWLIRHPEPEASAEGRCYGSLDWQLSPAGLEQAHAIAVRLASEPLAAIYTSPRRRCVQATEILAAGRSCAVATLDALRELDFGQFEGHRYDEIAELYPALYHQWMEHPTAVQFPGGENFAVMRKRVLDAAADLRIRHEGKSIALVTHGGVNRIILADALGMDSAAIFRIAQHHGAVNLIRYCGETPLVELVNSH
jgi:alpha-ribazole phosphatase/probable phosphoglycerate mutase